MEEYKITVPLQQFENKSPLSIHKQVFGLS